MSLNCIAFICLFDLIQYKYELIVLQQLIVAKKCTRFDSRWEEVLCQAFDDFSDFPFEITKMFACEFVGTWFELVWKIDVNLLSAMSSAPVLRLCHCIHIDFLIINAYAFQFYGKIHH